MKHLQLLSFLDILNISQKGQIQAVLSFAAALLPFM